MAAPPIRRSGSANDACHLNYLTVFQSDSDVIETLCIVKLSRQNWIPRNVKRTDDLQHYIILTQLAEGFLVFQGTLGVF